MGTFKALCLLSAEGLFLCSAGAAAQRPTLGPTTDATSGWHADERRIAELEAHGGGGGFNYREERVGTYALPDPLLTGDGTRVTDAAGWERVRRPETLALFASHVYGRAPAAPARVEFEVRSTDRAAVGGAATLRRVVITSSDAGGKSFAFEAAVFVPNGAARPVPAFLLINNRDVAAADPSRASKTGFWPVEEIVGRGYATAVFRTQDVDPDDPRPAARARGVRGVWPEGGGAIADGDAWGTIAAWAWGASRVLDYLRTVPEVDGSRVAVVGHSRGGKTALWAGAQDTRFAMAVSNESGEGGAALARRNFGETVRRINTSFPHWFAANYKRYNDRASELPVDQHQLVALLAPRLAYVASAGDDLWSDPRGEFLSVVGASDVYRLYGPEGFGAADMPPLAQQVWRGRIGYHVRPGKHDLTAYDWRQFMAFAAERWPGSK